MSTQHVAPVVTQPLTRRALREAERLSATATSSSPSAIVTIAHPAPSEPAQPQRYPTRAELRRAALAAAAAADAAAERAGNGSAPAAVVVYPRRADLRRVAPASPVPGVDTKVDPTAKFTAFGIPVSAPVLAAAQAVAADIVALMPAEHAAPAAGEVGEVESVDAEVVDVEALPDAPLADEVVDVEAVDVEVVLVESAEVADVQAAGDTPLETAAGATSAVAAVGAVDSSGRRWVPRVALLGALGAVTIVAPLSGVTGSESAAAAGVTPSPAASPALAAAAPTVVDHLSAGATAVQEASALAEDPTAATRALTTASRSYQREALECPVESGANGTLGAVMGGEAPEQIVMPVADGSYRITSRYGYRTYPFAGMHEGADFAGSLGTPLHAVADGVVTYVGGPRDGRTGTIVVIKSQIDGQDVEFWYGHQYSYGPRVVVGEEVVAGEVIGQIGNSGRSTGPHLHFEVHPGAGSETTDPLSWLQAHDAKPVSQAAACA